MPSARNLALTAALGLVVSCASAPEPNAILVQAPAGPISTSVDGPGNPDPDSSKTTTTKPAETYPDNPGELASLSEWGRCDSGAAGFRCAELTVPLDWSKPKSGQLLHLDVTMKPATGKRVAALFFNPGGPGVQGVGFIQGFVQGSLPQGLAQSFDLVSWNPRGTTGDSQISCSTSGELLEATVDPTPDTPQELENLRVHIKAEVKECLDEDGAIMPFVGTRSTVRDLDALRFVTGEKKLSYVGFSYGTRLGMEYLRMFPNNIRAMVLDGVTFPGEDTLEVNLAQAIGFERALDSYLADCPKRPSCKLGSDPKKKLMSILGKVEAERVPASYGADSGYPAREGTLGPGEFYLGVAAALYDKSSWLTLDIGLTQIDRPQPSGAAILQLRDNYLGRTVTGEWESIIDPNTAINCADQSARASEPEGPPGLGDKWSKEAPFWGEWFALGGQGCYGIPAAIEPEAPYRLGGLKPSAPVMVVGTTNDPATPYEQAVTAQKIIEKSQLLTFRGDGHTAYRGASDCVDSALTAYLVSLKLPKKNLEC